MKRQIAVTITLDADVLDYIATEVMTTDDFVIHSQFQKPHAADDSGTRAEVIEDYITNCMTGDEIQDAIRETALRLDRARLEWFFKWWHSIDYGTTTDGKFYITSDSEDLPEFYVDEDNWRAAIDAAREASDAST